MQTLTGMENEIPPKTSSIIGWPFWIPTILTTVPFTFVFLQLFPDHEPLPWWENIMAGVVGLMPATILGLIVQALWNIVVAAAKGNLIIVDCFFAFLLLAFCAGLAWMKWQEYIKFSAIEVGVVSLFVLAPLIGFYLRQRPKRKGE